MPTRISCLIPCEWRAASATSAFEVGSVPTAFSVWSSARGTISQSRSPIAQANPTKWIATPSARGTWRAFSQSTPGRIADAMITASRSRATRTFRCQIANAPAITATATRVATKDLRATSLIAEVFSSAALVETDYRPFTNTCSHDRMSIDGRGRARRSRRAGAQPQGHHRPAAPERADLHHRPVRVGEVQPGLRHDLRRGAAPLRRVAVGLRAAVPADDGEARRRLDRRALAGDLDRPEDDLAEPALDGRHGDRDLRLPAPALRARRSAALPDLRPPDRRPVDRGDRRPGARARRRGRSSR